MIKHDLLWKSIIESFFSDFLDFFFSDYVHLIDKNKGFVFLDKELDKLSIRSKGKQRFSDKLIKVILKTGEERGILIHIEVQGYVEENFAERMYINQYRIFDRFELPTAAFVIYTDNSPSFHPKAYDLNIFNTQILYTFPTYKLREKKLSDFRVFKDNPFSIILETAWWGLRKNKLTQEQLFTKKISLYKRLRKLGLDRKKIKDLLDFIKSYTKFDSNDLNLKFEKEIDKLSKTLELMTVQEAIILGTKLDAMEEGKEKGINIGLNKGVNKGVNIGLAKSMEIMDMLNEGITEKEISKRLEIDISIVKKINKRMKR